MSFNHPSDETREAAFLRVLPYLLNPALIRTSNLFRDLLANNSYHQFIMLVMGFALPIDHPMKLTETHFLSVLFLIKLFSPLDNLDVHFQHIIDELEASLADSTDSETIGNNQEYLNFMYSLAQAELDYR
jgi:hypothetical protein